MLRHLLLLPLLLAATVLRAQVHDEVPDSLVALREAMLHYQPDTACAPPGEYTLVWKEEREGHHYQVFRADGSTLKDYLLPDGQLRPEIHTFDGPGSLIYYGDRYAVITVSPDTGLIRYALWYFERKRSVSIGHD